MRENGKYTLMARRAVPLKDAETAAAPLREYAVNGMPQVTGGGYVSVGAADSTALAEVKDKDI